MGYNGGPMGYSGGPVGYSRSDGVLVGDRYLSPTGNDSSDGLTRQTAWLTPAKMSDWFNSLSSGQTGVGVVLAGDYVPSDGFTLTKDGVIGTLQFEEGVTIDTSAEVSRVDGFDIQGTGRWTLYLRGLQFTGHDVSSANGIGTTGVTYVRVFGAASDGTKAVFSGFDDGLSFHSTSVDTEINDCRFENSSKSAFAHVGTSFGVHNRCEFIGKAGASLGIGDDQSTETKSTFRDCTFTPTGGNQICRLYNATRCVIGSFELGITTTFLDTTAKTFTDCFIHWSGSASTYDGPPNYTMTRCYGFLANRIRGTNASSPLFTNCVFKGKAGTETFMNGNFDSDGINWLGGNATFRDCILNDYAVGFAYQTTAQRDHMAANWEVENCNMFDVTTQFEAGLTLGTNIQTTDPLLGPCDTTVQADWGYLSGSPCIGAGTGGGNIGFAGA